MAHMKSSSCDLKTARIASRRKLSEAFYGLTFNPSGSRLFASGGEFKTVHAYDFADGQLKDSVGVRLLGDRPRGVVAGLACTRDGKTLFAADGWDPRVFAVSLDQGRELEHQAIAPNGVNKDRQVNPNSPSIELPIGSYPYAVLPTRDSKRLYVSLWGGGAVAKIDPLARKVDAVWPVGSSGVGGATSHPTEMVLSPDEKLLYVACANGSSAIVLDTTSGRPLEEISSALYPGAPPGSTPNSLALSPDGKVLAIANADNNNLAMIDVSRPGASHSLGFIPVGWYPTSVRFSNDGKQIYVANGKGIKPMANPNGPKPLGKKQKGKPERIYRRPAARHAQHHRRPFAGRHGSLHGPSLRRQSVAERSGAVSKSREADNPIPAAVGKPSPIKHCIYVIKENRTYDQVFGDMKDGNGEAKLCIFGEKTTPNLHALVRQFVLLDNFYAEAEVSADGHEWSTAAYANDFVEKTWPLNYRGSPLHAIEYPSEGKLAISVPLAGRIWDRCQEAGVSYRSYGEFIDPGPKRGDPWHAMAKSLEGHFDPLYHGWDLDYPDAKRIDRFIVELHEFEKSACHAAIHRDAVAQRSHPRDQCGQADADSDGRRKRSGPRPARGSG